MQLVHALGFGVTEIHPFYNRVDEMTEASVGASPWLIDGMARWIHQALHAGHRPAITRRTIQTTGSDTPAHAPRRNNAGLPAPGLLPWSI